MKAKLALAFSVVVIAGAVCGVAICETASFHKLLARMTGRSEQIALHYRSRHEKISRSNVDREYELLRAQFADEKMWRTALRANHLSRWLLRREVAANLRARAWLDRQVAMAASDEECREYFAANQSQFLQPLRYRAAHLFLAAPAETAEEVVDVKRRTIEELEKRVKAGESFVDLVAQFSEDEATKKQGGDLGYFSDGRMPEDFMAVIRSLHVGETSGVVQTQLGFHIIQLREVKESRAMPFAEARPEIAAQLENEKRRSAAAKLIVDLAVR